MLPGRGAVATSPAVPTSCSTGLSLRLQPRIGRKAPRAAAAAPCRAADEGQAAAPLPAASAGARLPAAALTRDVLCSTVSDAGAAQRGTQPHAAAEQPQGAQAAVGELDIPAELLPRHLALIMDGNSRWAAARGRPAAAGYAAGVEALRTVVRCCHAWGVPCLTVYAFSSENWGRPAAEVAFLLGLMERVLAAEVAQLAAAGMRLRFIGEDARLPPSLRRQIRSAELATADNCDLHLTIALSYSGRQDLTLAVKELVRQAAAGQLSPSDVTPEAIAAQLATRQLPAAWRDPDLVIRTSGEQRLSNFMCWEAAYSELHFSQVPWPDFGERELAAALRDYAGRERRFGGRRPGSGRDSGAGSSGSRGGGVNTSGGVDASSGASAGGIGGCSSSTTTTKSGGNRLAAN